MTEAKQEEEIFSKCNQDFLKKIQKKYFGVIFCDPHGRFIFVNNVVLEKTGFDRNWFDAKTIYDFVLPEEKIIYTVVLMHAFKVNRCITMNLVTKMP